MYIWRTSNVHIVYTSIYLTYKTHAVIRREFWTRSKSFPGLGAQRRITAFTGGLLTNTTYAKRTHTLSQHTPLCWWKFTYVDIRLSDSSECDRAIRYSSHSLDISPCPYCLLFSVHVGYWPQSPQPQYYAMDGYPLQHHCDTCDCTLSILLSWIRSISMSSLLAKLSAANELHLVLWWCGI